MTRSQPPVGDRAFARRGVPGIAPAQDQPSDPPLLADWGGGAVQSDADESVRRELARLTDLLHRNFAEDGEAGLLKALADTSDPVAADSARHFLEQIRRLAEALAADARRWASSAPTAAAIADFQREVLSLLEAVDQRLHA